MLRLADLRPTLRDVSDVLRAVWRGRPFLIVGVAFMAAAIVLVLAHVWVGHVEVRPKFWNDKFNLGRERGYGERLEHVMLMAAAGAFAVGAVANRSRIHGVAAMLLTVLVLDNLFMGHERFGAFVHRLSGGVVPAEAGQFAAFGAVGLAGVALLVRAFDRSRREDRARVMAGLLMLFPVAVFGVGVDALQPLAEERMERLFTVAEDGGELLSIALLAATVIAIETDALLKARRVVLVRHQRSARA